MGSTSGEVWKRCIFPEFYPNSTRYPILSLLKKVGTSRASSFSLHFVNVVAPGQQSIIEFLV